MIEGLKSEIRKLFCIISLFLTLALQSFNKNQSRIHKNVKNGEKITNHKKSLSIPRTVCYPREKIRTSILILLHIFNHWFLKRLCIIMKSSYLTTLSLYCQPTWSYQNYTLPISPCCTNKNSEFHGHINPLIWLPAFTWLETFFLAWVIPN